ncbi:8713_t:CDS:1, partial [Paraglomus occultum]
VLWVKQRLRTVYLRDFVADVANLELKFGSIEMESHQHNSKKGRGSSEVQSIKVKRLVKHLLVQLVFILKQGKVEDENAESNFMKE